MQLNLHMQPKQLKVINKMEFKDRLRLKMKEKGVTPYKIGKDTQVTRQSVDSYVKGKSMPNSEYIDILAKYLGTTTDYLLNGSENDMFVDDIVLKNEKPEEYDYKAMYFKKCEEMSEICKSMSEMYSEMSRLREENETLRRDMKIRHIQKTS